MGNSQCAKLRKTSCGEKKTGEKWANGVTDHGVMNLSGVSTVSVCVYIKKKNCLRKRSFHARLLTLGLPFYTSHPSNKERRKEKSLCVAKKDEMSLW